MAAQGLAVEVGGGGEQRVQRRVGRLARLVRGGFLRGHFHAGGFGQFLDSLGKSRLSWSMMKPRALPPAPQPKQ
jgi:hypothetical protein